MYVDLRSGRAHDSCQLSLLAASHHVCLLMAADVRGIWLLVLVKFKENKTNKKLKMDMTNYLITEPNGNSPHVDTC
jgi:hypothetical protein